MSLLDISIQKLHPQAIVPQYMTDHAAGMDLCAALDEPIIVNPGQRLIVPTGIAMAIPPGFEGQVRPRSGLAIRQGITLLNSPGTIDADYRGEIGVIIINHGSDEVTFKHGDRIAQLVIAPVIQSSLRVVSNLSETDRGDGGFGHTGLQNTEEK